MCRPFTVLRRVKTVIVYEFVFALRVIQPRRAARCHCRSSVPHALYMVDCWRRPPRTSQTNRATAFRRGTLSSEQWLWGMIAALCFAATIHASIVLLFRFVPFPVAEFRQGYDFSFIPTVPLRWLAVMISATSAGICEETGFRGYMQRPMELSYGTPVAILISALFFTVLHLTKGWALAGMVPIIFRAGVLLGSLARSSRSLIPCIIGHTIMDIGLFAYWWTGIAGEFSLRPIGETGVDRAFVIACIAACAMLAIIMLAIWKLRSLRQNM
jgi:membrane protease YdiL (CAAX protease family)